MRVLHYRITSYNVCYTKLLRLAWDTFIFGATIFNGLFMVTQRGTWRVLGVFGVIFGVLGFVFNYSVWPANPGNAGLIDIRNNFV